MWAQGNAVMFSLGSANVLCTSLSLTSTSNRISSYESTQIGSLPLPSPHAPGFETPRLYSCLIASLAGCCLPLARLRARPLAQLPPCSQILLSAAELPAVAGPRRIENLRLCLASPVPTTTGPQLLAPSDIQARTRHERPPTGCHARCPPWVATPPTRSTPYRAPRMWLLFLAGLRDDRFYFSFGRQEFSRCHYPGCRAITKNTLHASSHSFAD